MAQDNVNRRDVMSCYVLFQAHFRERPAHPATTSEFKQIEFFDLTGSARLHYRRRKKRIRKGARTSLLRFRAECGRRAPHSADERGSGVQDSRTPGASRVVRLKLLRSSGGQGPHQIHLGDLLHIDRALIGILCHCSMGSKEARPISS
jgi:hypothetical protein